MNYYDLEAIGKKLLRPYEKGDLFRNCIEQKSDFTLEIPLKKVRQTDLQNDFTAIRKSIKELRKIGYPLLFETVQFKTIGAQSVPTKIVIHNRTAYLEMIGKKEEFEYFCKLQHHIVNTYPSLKSLLLRKPSIVLDYAGVWDHLLSILSFFLQHPDPSCYIREINIEEVDTKFIHKHLKIIDTLLSHIQKTQPLTSLKEYAFEKKYRLNYPQPLVRFRILDPKQYISGISDISVPIGTFKHLDIPCENVLIVENKITVLSLFPIDNTMVIFGQGYGVNILKEAAWLKKKRLYYWGDIDIDGFAILSQLRSYFPHTQSLCMDEKTLQRFHKRSVQASVKNRPKLVHLTENEKRVYERLQNDYYGKDFRLEQELIPLDHVQKVIKEYFKLYK